VLPRASMPSARILCLLILTTTPRELETRPDERSEESEDGGYRTVAPD
jgi:hypothetical protein